MTSNEIRNAFLKYFEQRGHQIVPSSSLVPHDDPTLLFTNAGMVQFKRVFLQEERRPYVRAVSSQKCVRAGGKHNDLENVGHTARHHTFFEMLGNFSFGDYFKEGAIEMGWDFLTRVLGLPKDRLWITIHEGDREMGLGPDEEARQIWQNFVPEERIRAFSTKDNFWSMGDTGPCGPCSEITIDQGENVGCGRPDCGLGCDCDRFLELWNLVFMQYNRDASGRLVPLPKPSIDTGLGLERIAAVVQGVTSNYDTDLFRPIIAHVEDVASREYGVHEKDDISIRVIADHARASAFLIGDGVLPEKEGRGYVLRRIMRRALRHGRKLGVEGAFFSDVVDLVIDLMGEAYPDLKEHRNFIRRVVSREEESFSDTLNRGLDLLREEVGLVKKRGMSTLPGFVVFRLYDTYGFPVDLVEDIVREEGIGIDLDAFDRAMATQRQKARQAWKGSGEEDLRDEFKRLLADGVETAFVGYQRLKHRSRVVRIIRHGTFVDRASEGEDIEILTEESPFYGETGGQVGDRGTITSPEGLEIEISDTLRPVPQLLVHVGHVKRGSVELGTEVLLSVDPEARGATALNHTGTHLLHAALRDVLGDHVKQAGSLVAPHRLRFDFTHFSALTPEELDRIEDVVNQRIRENVPVRTRVMATEEAKKSGATALFGEKYGDRARVVAIGRISKELCGGTHTRRTGDLGLFKIISESAVAAGVRRIEALTGADALHHVRQQEKTLMKASAIVKSSPEQLDGKLEKVVTQLRRLEREVESLKTRIATGGSDHLEQVREIGGIRVLAVKPGVGDPRSLREIGDRFKEKIGSGIVFLAGEHRGKAAMVLTVTRDLLDRFNAGSMIRELARKVGGTGGGRPDMAQGGGPHPERIDEVIEELYLTVEKSGAGTNQEREAG
ncbi:MAG: alanine--tRNA ligase [Deltaproteobacteria bacterium]|nr:alanine--tRNA ligase [Deltaproteobacteria bacterium]